MMEIFGGEKAVRENLSCAVKVARAHMGVLPHELAERVGLPDCSKVKELENEMKIPQESILLDLLWALGLSLDRVMPIVKLSDSDRAHWQAEMEKKKTGSLASCEGLDARNVEGELNIFLRIEALRTICPSPQPMSDKLKAIREKLGFITTGE